jgi:putative MATE family efflux protein
MVSSGENTVERLFSRKQLAKLIIPLIIDQTLSMSIGMFDTFMVSSAGEAAVSGVSIVNTINIMFIYLFAALATGGSIVVGQYLGNKDRRNGRIAAEQLLKASAFVSLLITILCVALNGQIISLFFGKIEAGVMDNARSYFYITALSCPFIALFNAGSALFRSMGDSKTAMINSLIMNLFNIIGNAVFIYGLGWGSFGAGLATTLSRIIGAVAILTMIKKSMRDITIVCWNLKNINLEMIKRILSIGLPTALDNSIFQLGKIVLTGLVAVFGTQAIAANAVGQSIAGVAVIPSFSIALALTTVIAQCVGAREYEQASYYLKQLLIWSYIFMFILNAVILLFIKPIISLFNLSVETDALAFQIVMVHGLAAVVLSPSSFALANALRAAGDAQYPMVVSIISMGVLRIGASFVLAYALGFGALSIWIAMVFDWAARSICFTLRWKGGRWQMMAVI